MASFSGNSTDFARCCFIVTNRLSRSLASSSEVQRAITELRDVRSALALIPEDKQTDYLPDGSEPLWPDDPGLVHGRFIYVHGALMHAAKQRQLSVDYENATATELAAAIYQ
jgi:hypothetical protein